MNRRLFTAIHSGRRRLVLTFAFSVLAGFVAIVQAIDLAFIVNSVFIDKRTLADISKAMAILIALIVLRAVSTWLAESSANIMAVQVKSELRVSIIKHLMTLGPAYVKGERSGELVNAVFTGIEQLDPYLTRYLPQVVLSVFIPISILAFTFTKDLLSAGIFIVTAPLIPIFMILVGKAAQVLTDRQWRTLSVLSAHFFDVLQGLTTLKVFNRSKHQVQVIARMSDQYRITTMGTLRVAFLSAFVLELLTTLSTAMVAVAIGLRLLHGDMSFAAGFVVLLLAPEFYAPFRMLGAQYHASMNGVTAMERLFEILEASPQGITPMPDVAQAPSFASNPVLSVRNLSFTYEGAERAAIANVSFELGKGEIVAIVGPSGAGKSTMLDLILGFARPNEGEVRIGDAFALDSSVAAQWREQIAYVSQHPHLFHGSIMDNLLLAKPTASTAEVRRAVKLARADLFIDRLPNGLDTVVGEDAQGLSGGEAQRLALARAFLRDSSLLLLDEPTAHLDAESEQLIQEALTTLLSTRSALIVAHRLNTVTQANRIVVLDRGSIVQMGDHRQLLAESGLYRQLLTAYTGGALA
jgi:ATP-binding cassette subfamily C protein CydD